MVYILLMRYYSAIKKKILPFLTTDKTEEHQAQLNKSHKERQLLDDPNYTWNLKNPQLIDSESRFVV